jgi:hypothetical protein
VLGRSVTRGGEVGCYAEDPDDHAAVDPDEMVGYNGKAAAQTVVAEYLESSAGSTTCGAKNDSRPNTEGFARGRGSRSGDSTWTSVLGQETGADPERATKSGSPLEPVLMQGTDPHTEATPRPVLAWMAFSC